MFELLGIIICITVFKIVEMVLSKKCEHSFKVEEKVLVDDSHFMGCVNEKKYKVLLVCSKCGETRIINL